jgi:hypothetical protein
MVARVNPEEAGKIKRPDRRGIGEAWACVANGEDEAAQHEEKSDRRVPGAQHVVEGPPDGDPQRGEDMEDEHVERRDEAHASQCRERYPVRGVGGGRGGHELPVASWCSQPEAFP